jgi:hypothetical protein
MNEKDSTIIRKMYDEAICQRNVLAKDKDSLYREFAPIVNRIDTLIEIAKRLKVNLNEKST